MKACCASSREGRRRGEGRGGGSSKTILLFFLRMEVTERRRRRRRCDMCRCRATAEGRGRSTAQVFIQPELRMILCVPQLKGKMRKETKTKGAMPPVGVKGKNVLRTPRLSSTRAWRRGENDSLSVVAFFCVLPPPTECGLASFRLLLLFHRPLCATPSFFLSECDSFSLV